MKKIFSMILCASLFAFASCSQDEDLTNEGGTTTGGSEAVVPKLDLPVGPTAVTIPDGITKVRAVNWADQKEIGVIDVVDNKVWFSSSNGWTTIQLYDANLTTLTKGDNGYIGSAEIRQSDDAVVNITNAKTVLEGELYTDFLNIFPGGVDNRYKDYSAITSKFTHDVLYKSDGNPFSIYPIYSLGWYDLTLGIFYYDADAEGEIIVKTYDFWNMQDVDPAWKTPYDTLSANNVKDMTQYEVKVTGDARGYKITLPKGYVFGFYVSSSNNDGKNGTYYSYSGENSCGEEHAVNFVLDGKNYIGFEDQDRGDWDINDLICYITPELDTTKVPRRPDIPVIPIPDDYKKLIHYTGDCGLDIEARLNKGPYDYLRLSLPLYATDDVKLKLESFQQFCEMDDTRIVTASDEEIIYINDGESKPYKIGEKVEVVCTNNNTATTYKDVTVKVTSEKEDGVYELKVELYPKGPEQYEKLIAYLKALESSEYGICSLIERTPNPASMIPSYKKKIEASLRESNEWADNLTTWQWASTSDLESDLLSTKIANSADGEIFAIKRVPFSGPETLVRIFCINSSCELTEWNATTQKWEPSKFTAVSIEE